MGAESAEDEAKFIVGIAVLVETAEHEEPTACRDLIIETFARGYEPKHRPTPAPAAIRIDTS